MPPFPYLILVQTRDPGPGAAWSAEFLKRRQTAVKEIYSNLVETKPAAQACCQFGAVEGGYVP
jgi:hypothetical protein